MPEVRLWFDHGLGDCVHIAFLLQLYKRRGWDVVVHHEQNKSLIFHTADLPYVGVNDNVAHHPWVYQSSFNRPTTNWDGAGNKIAGNLNEHPLEPIGDPEELWEELCGIEFDADDAVTDEHWQATDRFLEDLPKPCVLIHTHGTNFPEGKNLDTDLITGIYRQLLEGMDGTIILLDWDHRAPTLPHARVRHVKDDWEHIDLERLYCLMRRSQLLIGVDSGPWHFSKLTGIPGVGVFHHHYPSCVCLPRPEAVHVTRSAPEYRAVSQPKRRRWNIVEYAGGRPTAEEVAAHALRMLHGPRYLRDRRRMGRDVQLQQWVRDWCRGSTGSSWLADRHRTFDFLLQESTRRFEAPTIVETGCIRSAEDWAGAGNSTYLFGAYLDGLEAGHLTSVDNSAEHCEFARQETACWGPYVAIEHSDSAEWLASCQEPIDVLYLDSMDVDVPGHAEYALGEFHAAESRLHDTSLVVFDDTTWDKGWAGKGALAVPEMLRSGWRIVSSGYQVIMTR